MQNYIIAFNRANRKGVFLYFCGKNSLMKRFLAVLLLLAACVNGFCVEVDSLFLQLPSEVLPQLDRTARLNLLDYYRAGIASNVTDNLGGKCEISHCDSVLLTLNQGETTRLQLRLYADEGVVAVVETYRSLFAYSRLSFYRYSDWSPANVAWPNLQVSEFVRPSEEGDKAEWQIVCRKLEQAPFFCYEFRPGLPNLFCSLSVGLLSIDEQEFIEPYVTQWKSYTVRFDVP